MVQSLRSSYRGPGRYTGRFDLLLLDDDNEFREALATNLREDGYSVIDFPSPQLVTNAALARVAIVVTDDLMKGEDGLTFTDRFHDRHPDVPVVMLTAFITHHLEFQVALRPDVQILRKPVDYDELHSLLDRLCIGRRDSQRR